MSEISIEQVSAIVDAAQELDRVETHLKAAGKGDLAGKLGKLQQDAGVMFARYYDPAYDAAAGPQTANLEREFEGVSGKRVLSVIRECQPHVNGTLQSTLGDVAASFVTGSAARRAPPIFR